MEPTLTIEFTATQLQSLGVLLDAAVKAGGMSAAKLAVPIQDMLEAAVAEYNAALGVSPAEETESGHA